MRIVSPKSGRLITWSGNQSKKQQQVASVHNTGDCIELTKSRPWRCRKNLVNCSGPTCSGLHQTRGHPHPPPSWCHPYKQLFPTHWSTDQTIRDWGSSNSQNYPPPWSAPNGVLPPQWRGRDLVRTNIVPPSKTPPNSHIRPRPTHPIALFPGIKPSVDDLCKLLHRSSVPRIIHYTSSASTDLIFVQKNYATADIEAKKIRQKACKSRHLLICNKSA